MDFDREIHPHFSDADLFGCTSVWCMGCFGLEGFSVDLKILSIMRKYITA